MAHTGSSEITESYRTELLAWGNNTAIEVPIDTLEKFGAGKRPGMVITLNGYEYRSTVATMDGMHLLAVRKDVRDAAGISPGDMIDVTLMLEQGPRPVDLSDDFAAALDAQPQAREFYDALSNSLQRMHVDSVNSAKTPETRQRRIDKAVALFLEGKKR